MVDKLQKHIPGWLTFLRDILAISAIGGAFYLVIVLRSWAVTVLCAVLVGALVRYLTRRLRSKDASWKSKFATATFALLMAMFCGVTLLLSWLSSLFRPDGSFKEMWRSAGASSERIEARYAMRIEYVDERWLVQEKLEFLPAEFDRSEALLSAWKTHVPRLRGGKFAFHQVGGRVLQSRVQIQTDPTQAVAIDASTFRETLESDGWKFQRSPLAVRFARSKMSPVETSDLTPTMWNDFWFPETLYRSTAGPLR
jgi:hypothetical protein